MRYLTAIAAIALAFVPAAAQQTLSYSWEDGGTILGYYGNVAEPLNVSGVQGGLQGSELEGYTCPGPNSGTHYLHVAEDPHNSTPYAIVAWVTDLLDGDVITASVHGYDVTPGGSPSIRIWGGNTGPLDANDYISSAGSSGDYTAGTGWDVTESTWTYAGGNGNGLAIQARLYSTPITSDPDHTDFWIDDVTVTAPLHATIVFPEPYTAIEESSWTAIKAFFR